MIHGYSNYKELIISLAKTDFKLRYQGSFLGYIWAIIKPLSLFAILNFVFSSVFNANNNGIPYYSLELLTGLLLFNFFAEGTSAGLSAFVTKSQLVTKVYVPRWTLLIASTLNSFFIFLANLLVLILFFGFYDKVPTWQGVLVFALFIFFLYILIAAFTFLVAPLYVRYRDLSMIWEVALSVLMYASPIVYPISIMSPTMQQILLINPVAFIIHFSKQALISNHFATLGQMGLFIMGLAGLFGFCFLMYRKTVQGIAEYL